MLEARTSPGRVFPSSRQRQLSPRKEGSWEMSARSESPAGLRPLRTGSGHPCMYPRYRARLLTLQS